MRKVLLLSALVGLVGLMNVSPGRAQNTRNTGSATRYLVLYANGASLQAAHNAVHASGGTIVRENTRVGLATVVSRNPNFLADANRQGALEGAARNIPIGYAAPDRVLKKPDPAERDRVGHAGRAPKTPTNGVEADPLSGLQWDMKMIHATEDGSYAVQPGDPRVIVAIIDTGIDGSHPDIAPNFNSELSRNWTTDIPLIDGLCEDEPDQSCEDPPDVDENGHGTHVAGTVAAALNGLGVAGIAPGITLVNDRAGQDSGFFFLQETVNALTYAGDIGADVVNMSYFTDPWLYNCASNPADTPEQQHQQRVVIRATQRALTYAHDHGVTLVAAEGNGHTDLGNPKKDLISPDFPPGAAYRRTVDNSCLTMPTEGKYVIGVTALGPEAAKAYYSDYGLEQADVSAPGGDRRWYYGTPQYNAVENRILSTYPESLAIANGEVNPDGTPNTPFVVRNCSGGVCAYYQYLQGTSMASPHAVGVAALIVSQFGVDDPNHPGQLTLNPSITRDILYATAIDHACPDPRKFVHPDPTLPGPYTAVCFGPPELNGFYGNGIVDALNAVIGGP